MIHVLGFAELKEKSEHFESVETTVLVRKTEELENTLYAVVAVEPRNHHGWMLFHQTRREEKDIPQVVWLQKEISHPITFKRTEWLILTPNCALTVVKKTIPFSYSQFNFLLEEKVETWSNDRANLEVICRRVFAISLSFGMASLSDFRSHFIYAAEGMYETPTYILECRSPV